MSNARYVQLTIHDNDFWATIEFVSELLRSLIDYFGHYGSYDITDEDLQQLKDDIQHLLYGTYRIHNYLFHRERDYPSFDYFKPTVKIVDYLDIPDWDNNQSVFVPLFENGDIIIR